MDFPYPFLPPHSDFRQGTHVDEERGTDSVLLPALLSIEHLEVRFFKPNERDRLIAKESRLDPRRFVIAPRLTSGSISTNSEGHNHT